MKSIKKLHFYFEKNANMSRKVVLTKAKRLFSFNNDELAEFYIKWRQAYVTSIKYKN